jgi:hypothetical protein
LTSFDALLQPAFHDPWYERTIPPIDPSTFSLGYDPDARSLPRPPCLQCRVMETNLLPGVASSSTGEEQRHGHIRCSSPLSAQSRHVTGSKSSVVLRRKDITREARSDKRSFGVSTLNSCIACIACVATASRANEGAGGIAWSMAILPPSDPYRSPKSFPQESLTEASSLVERADCSRRPERAALKELGSCTMASTR